MIRRLYVHNFRCLENFDLSLDGKSSTLLIGRNGSGKTTIGAALEMLQRAARGTNRIRELLGPQDFTRRRSDVPMRFEIEVNLAGKIFTYTTALELPQKFRELRVAEEQLKVDGEPIFHRELAQVRLSRRSPESRFPIDWHLLALPIINQQSEEDPIFIFKQWLASALILRPAPSRARGESSGETLQPNPEVTNFGEWFSGVLRFRPAVYGQIVDYLRQMMPDLEDIQVPQVGSESQRVVLNFSTSAGRLTVPFDHLSDGEKCFMVYGLVIAANDAYGPLLCFWDEPDNFLAPFEVGPSVMELRRTFRGKGQLIMTSHNPEAIRHFSDENTLVLYRRSHIEPPVFRSVEEVRGKGEFSGDFINALVRGDIGV